MCFPWGGSKKDKDIRYKIIVTVTTIITMGLNRNGERYQVRCQCHVMGGKGTEGEVTNNREKLCSSCYRIYTYKYVKRISAYSGTGDSGGFNDFKGNMSFASLPGE